MALRWTPVVLGALLLVVQADLWFGKGNVPYVMSLHEQLAEQRAANARFRDRNARVAAEVGDLRDGLEMVEEKARSELGMVRPDEIFVQIAEPGAASPLPAAGPTTLSAAPANPVRAVR